MQIVLGILLLALVVAQAQFVSDYITYPALPVQDELYRITPDYASYPGQTAAHLAGPWAYSFNPISEEVQQVPYNFPNLQGFLDGSQSAPGAVLATPVRTKRKNVLHYRNGEFRPILCSPRLCLLERPVGESEE